MLYTGFYTFLVLCPQLGCHLIINRHLSRLSIQLTISNLVGLLLSYQILFVLFSLLSIETADRPGLLLEVIKIVADTNVTVESAEIDTEVGFSLHISIYVGDLLVETL